MLLTLFTVRSVFTLVAVHGLDCSFLLLSVVVVHTSQTPEDSAQSVTHGKWTIVM